jgi:hypothetical protein
LNFESACSKKQKIGGKYFCELTKEFWKNCFLEKNIFLNFLCLNRTRSSAASRGQIAGTSENPKKSKKNLEKIKSCR